MKKKNGSSWFLISLVSEIIVKFVVSQLQFSIDVGNLFKAKFPLNTCHWLPLTRHIMNIRDATAPHMTVSFPTQGHNKPRRKRHSKEASGMLTKPKDISYSVPSRWIRKVSKIVNAPRIKQMTYRDSGEIHLSICLPDKRNQVISSKIPQ